MIFSWNEEKNELLKITRNVSFEEAVLAINHSLLNVEKHNNIANQIIFVVIINNYVHRVPAVNEGNNNYFLKTIYADRKGHKKYLGG